MLKKKGEWGKMSIWSCDECGKDFECFNNRANEAVRLSIKKFCCADCKLKNWKRNLATRLIKHVNEIGSSKFGGGIGMTTDGYIWIKINGKGYHGDQIKLHRYLMQVKLGRKLKSSEIVHHIDENKLNNDIDNLMIVTRAEHNRIHFKGKSYSMV